MPVRVSSKSRIEAWTRSELRSDSGSLRASVATSALLKSISRGRQPCMARPLRRRNDRRGLEVRGVDRPRFPRLASRERPRPHRCLTSNQVGLPAELKHINKRRKRN